MRPDTNKTAASTKLHHDLLALYSEESGLFHRLVAAGGLDPKLDFRYRDLRDLHFENADLRGFNFTGSDLRGTGVRFSRKLDNSTLLYGTTLDTLDQNWVATISHPISAAGPRPNGSSKSLAVPPVDYDWVKSGLVIIEQCIAGGGNPSDVGDSISAWLGRHAEALEASHVYKAWLDAGGDRALVEPSIRAWLGGHAETLEAQFVYKAWLEAKGAFSVVRDPVLAWLDCNKGNRDAVYALKFVLREPSLPTATIIAAAQWCETFADSDDAIWRLATLSRHLRNKETSREIALASLRVVECIDPDCFELSDPSDHRSDTVQVAQSTLFAMQTAVTYLQEDGVFTDRVALAHRRLLLHTAVYETVRQHPRMICSIPLVQHVNALFNAGHLVLSRDRAALRSFMDWIRAWPSDQRVLLRETFAGYRRASAHRQ